MAAPFKIFNQNIIKFYHKGNVKKKE